MRSRSGATPRRAIRVGLISDTHGLVRPEAVAFLRASDYIIHAGDIVDPAILDALRALAPVTAVRGNNDRGRWARALPQTAVLNAGRVSIHVIHDLAELDFDPSVEGFRVVVSGHSHRPKVEERGGVLYVNPGSAGPRRFSLPVCAAALYIRGTEVEAQIARLAIMAK